MMNIKVVKEVKYKGVPYSIFNEEIRQMFLAENDLPK